MKGLIGLLVALALVAGFAAPSFASECETLATQVEEKLSSSQATDENLDKAEGLLNEGRDLCESGEDSQAVAVLRQALALLG